MDHSGTDKQKYFLALYEPVKDRLWRYIRSMVWHKDDARDIESETILQAYASLHTLRNAEAFLYFLFGIASRLLKQKERKRKLFRLFMQRPVTKSEFIDPAHRLDTEILYAAIKKLSHKERETFTLFEIAELSIKEIAGMQGDTSGAIKTRLSRSRQKLANYLEGSRPGKKSSQSPDSILPDTSFNFTNLNA